MNARITKDKVDHIAWLARIKVTETEKENFTKLFNEILEYFEKIDEVDTTDVDYTFHGVQIKNVLRDDVVKSSLSKEDVFKNIPKKDKNYIKAPRMT